LGAAVVGELDLSFVKVPFPLRFVRCRATNSLFFTSAEIPSLHLTGSWIRGLNAAGAKFAGSIFLNWGFTSTGEVTLVAAEIGGSLACGSGTLKNPPQRDSPQSGQALNAEGARVAGSVMLHGGFMAEGEVRLTGAQIGGNLACNFATFKNPPQKDVPEAGTALDAEGARIQGGVLFRNGFTAEGEVSLYGAQIGISLECHGGTFRNPKQKDLPGSGTALSADAARVTGGVFLRGGFMAEGEVSLYGAQIGISLECEDGEFKNRPQKDVPGGGAALDAVGVRVAGDVLLGGNFMAEGEVHLLGAQIGGSLTCDGGTFTNPSQKDLLESGTALRANNATVTGNVGLRQGFRAEGEVQLLGVHIGGSLTCDGGTFTNPPQKDLLESGTALRANNATVTGNVDLRQGFTAEGEVQLLGVHIGGSLTCDGGTFKNPPREDLSATGLALNAAGAQVAGYVILSDRFSAEGEVRLLGAQIGRDLVCSDGAFGTLMVQSAAIKGNLFLARMHNYEGTLVDLINASVGSLIHDETSWPIQGNLYLDGFKYGHILEGPTDARTGLRWLDLQPEFRPEPYRQLAKVLREMGDDRGARRVLYFMEKRRRKQEDRKQAARFWGWVLKAAVGYGYYPARALGWLLALTCVGWFLFGLGYRAGSMAPTDREAYASFEQQNGLPRHYPRFNAPIYSLENSLPLIKLGQDSYWTPSPEPRSSAHTPGVDSGPVSRLGGSLVAHLPKGLLAPWLLRWFRWGQILAGWLLATLFVAGVTGIVRKE
jgi:hypothetical protein